MRQLCVCGYPKRSDTFREDSIPLLFRPILYEPAVRADAEDGLPRSGLDTTVVTALGVTDGSLAEAHHGTRLQNISAAITRVGTAALELVSGDVRLWHVELRLFAKCLVQGVPFYFRLEDLSR